MSIFHQLNDRAKNSFFESIAIRLCNQGRFGGDDFNLLSDIGLSSFDVLRIAVICKERGFVEVAREIINANLNINGECPFNFYEQAILELTRDLYFGIEILKKSVSIYSYYENTRLLFLLSFFIQDDELGDFCLLKAAPEIIHKIYTQDISFIRYLSVIKGDCFKSNSLFSGNKFCVVESKESMSFLKSENSVLRLGDGEGSMCTFSDLEEIKLKDVYLENRIHFSERWTGNIQSIQTLVDRQTLIMSNLDDFDAVGIPNPEWLMSCFASGDVRGFSCAWNAIRSLEMNYCTKIKIFFRTSVFYDFFHVYDFSDLFMEDESIILVSWNDMLPLLIKLKGFNGHINMVKIRPSFSDIKNVFKDNYDGALSDTQMIMRDVAMIDCGKKSTIVIAGGQIAKFCSIFWRKEGHRVLDVGSALDMSWGIPIR